MSIPGIDVSNYQATISWPQVAAAHIEFAIAKCSEGTGYADPYFAANWAGMKANNIARGAYHFARPDQNPDALAEARWFLQCLAAAGGAEPGDVVALDIEVGAGDLSDWALGWLQAVEAELGCKPLLYSGDWFMRDHGLEGDARLADYGLWLAAYQGSQPDPPAPWSFAAIWQYSDQGIVAGIDGKVDIDTFNGDAAAFRRYGVPPPPPKPQPTNDDNVEMIRLVLAPDLAGLVSYAGRFA